MGSDNIIFSHYSKNRTTITTILLQLLNRNIVIILFLIVFR
jgi:hypothetical protein